MLRTSSCVPLLTVCVSTSAYRLAYSVKKSSWILNMTAGNTKEFEACQWSLVLSIAMKRIDSIEASKTYRLYGVTDINITQLSSKRWFLMALISVNVSYQLIRRRNTSLMIHLGVVIGRKPLTSYQICCRIALTYAKSGCCSQIRSKICWVDLKYVT